MTLTATAIFFLILIVLSLVLFAALIRADYKQQKLAQQEEQHRCDES
jgi:membrane protein implicated in regulation of membrane protease activity